uniref:uncharacterized protein LOC108950670 n=1 Tax=Ciona intestinalis TaxID=7719 RepID=UPI00089DAD5B|nr:uncharacterized protein LOC108950670 [Ciona intestinalis]|eukprot:XP_018672257.1 uncharacterized protein LOC108950670 [Ciona intestinalis]
MSQAGAATFVDADCQCTILTQPQQLNFLRLDLLKQNDTLQELNTWPTKEVVLKHMPKSFRESFQTTRVILDATEIEIEKPTNVNSQSSTFSTYKNKNTLKSMIGITPNGLVSFVSPAYGGSVSDRQIIENCKIYQNAPNFFIPGDSIMADRGILVQDLFAPFDVCVNTPTMLKGKHQLDATQRVHDRRVASHRIHVERLIGLSKTYKIPGHPLSPQMTAIGSRIIYNSLAKK